MLECIRTMERQEKIKRKMKSRLNERKKQHFGAICSNCNKLITIDTEGRYIYEKGYSDGWSDFEGILSEEMSDKDESKNGETKSKEKR